MSIYINNECTDPRYNLALEEYVLKNLDDLGNCILLWQNRPSVIIGKHQNTIEEINQDYIKQHDIFVVRRISGGGAVYHDLGNLNFTFIIKDQEAALYDFKRYTKPIINALQKMGVNAEFNSRNDLTIEGKKFSGNAQHIHRGKLLHHGTLLFNSELEVLGDALNVSEDKILSKGIKSVRSRVTNISEHLPSPMTIREFKKLLMQSLIEDDRDMYEYILKEGDLAEIEKLKNEKYSAWEWNYGQSPDFNFKNWKRFDGGKIEVLLDVQRGGTIKNCKIYGDFLGADDVAYVEEKLKGVRYELDDIKAALQCIDISRYFGSIGIDDIISCFF